VLAVPRLGGAVALRREDVLERLSLVRNRLADTKRANLETR
jgi:hypothetical protein